MSPRPSLHLRSRGPLFAAAASLAVACALSTERAPEPTRGGVAAWLGAAADVTVADDAYVWEASRGVATDALWGRDVLFLGASGDGWRDVYRARVRVWPSGELGAVRGFVRVTNTPLGDESGLVARGAFAAFATRWQGRVVRVELLELASPQHTGGLLEAARGLFGEPPVPRRTDLGLSRPEEAFSMELRADALVLSLGPAKEPAALFLPSKRLDPGRQGEGLHRTDPESPAPTDLLAGLGARLPFFGQTTGPLPRPTPRPLAPPSSAESGFPPAPLTAPLGEPWPGEGAWATLQESALPGAPPPIVSTFVRVDSSDPEAPIHLVVLDTRQLAVGYEAGRDTDSRTGAVGRAKARASAQARATWNGGGPAGSVGIVASGVPLSPPVADAPTIAVDSGGDVRFGAFTAAWFGEPWGARQSARALVSHGAAVPSDDQRAIPRSALGRTQQGHLVFAAAPRATPESLARALVLAGVSSAQELRSGPGALGFSAFSSDPSTPPTDLDGALPWAGRGLVTDSEGDFFFAHPRDPLAAIPPWEGSPFTPSPGRQPNPSWLPGVFEARSERLGTGLTLWLFAADRYEIVLRAGAREPRRKEASALAEVLPDELAARSLARLGLGIGPRRGGPALVVDGLATKPPRREGAVLLVTPEGAMSVVAGEGWDVPAGGSAAEVPLLADNGILLREARTIGRRRDRGALCQRDDGALLVAAARFDSNEVTAGALVELGCQRVVGLERGNERDASATRANDGATLPTTADDSALWVLGRASTAGRATESP